MKRSYLIATAIAVGAAIWVGSGAFGEGNQAEQKKAPADLSAAADVQKVRVLTLHSEIYQRGLVLRGSTEAERTVELKVEAAGRAIDLPIEKGQVVEQGELLVALAPEDRPAQLREAEALREQRRIEVEAARKLADKGYRSQTELAGAEAALQAADAAVERAQVAIDNLEIQAPFDGLLETRSVELGDYLELGESIGVLVDLDPIRVVGFANERQVKDLKLGTTGEAMLLGSEPMQGKITYIASAADPGTRTFRVELSLDNGDFSIPAGMTAEMRLPRSAIKAHKLSPAFLTLADDGRVGVRLVNTESRVEFKPVAIVGETRQAIWVTGLPEEANVIVVGQEFVRQGDLVEANDAQSLEPVLIPGTGS